MSKTKGGGSTKNGRDSRAKRLGPKVFDGQQIDAGTIIVRQRGTPIHPGDYVGRGGDDTLFALKPGTVKYHLRSGPPPGEHHPQLVAGGRWPVAGGRWPVIDDRRSVD